jgi:hypothetical protein
MSPFLEMPWKRTFVFLTFKLYLKGGDAYIIQVHEMSY